MVHFVRIKKGRDKMIEAIFYKKIDDNKVICQVCNHFCVIKNGQRGLCGVRENIDGVLYALDYGKTIAVAIDPIEKKPLYHYLMNTKIYSFATVGCNMHCPWCQNWDISQSPKPDKKIKGSYISPKDHVNFAIEHGCPAIAYTYSEPTIFLEYALDTMKIAKEQGIKNVWVTNGYMSKQTLETILPYLDAANVDYKGPDDGTYEKYCGGHAKLIMENMKAMQEHGVHLEITTLIIPGVNDQKEQLERIVKDIVTCLGQEVPWHISRFFPAWKMLNTPITPLATLNLAKEIGEKAGIKNIHLGNI